MKPELYQRFLVLKEQGNKAAAKAVLDEFVTSFNSWEEKQLWVRSFLHDENYGHKIRHEIYTHLVFPVLLDGYSRRDVWSIVWLAKTIQNIYTDQRLHAAIGFKSDLQLLTEAYALEPNEEIGQYLLEKKIHWFAHCQHEWPLGILYGMDGANLVECDEILQEIGFARTIDRSNQYRTFLDEFELKVNEYKQRLSQSES